MEPPSTSTHLQQFLCTLQWVIQGMPDFSGFVKPLYDVIERMHSTAGKRTKQAMGQIQLAEHGWSTSERTAFTTCKNSLAHQVTLAHRNPSQRLCVYTDASDLA